MATALPPSRATLAEFAIASAHQDAILNLPGGRGLTWRAGDTVLRPSAGDGETVWKATVLAELSHSAGFRTPRPIAARSGAWTVDGWEAWQWLPGAADETRVTDVLDAGEAFHQAVRGLDRPDFLDQADDPWARSDRIAWEEEEAPANATLHRLIAAFRPVSTKAQIIHGDLLGNVMFEPGQPPAIIDWAPYWRPVGFADAIVLADAACWHGLDPTEMLRLADERAEGRQCIIRALVFRIATFELLGIWDAEMESRHAPAVAAALS
ncbi:phosphotransferase [Microbacterium sp. WCS2018Hpa-23]|uniref:phosphotransferase n=1 Tax=Microbacterium sp. WCS2018Hpa-23 TaxID=3073634 RepID=UPI0028831C89|nr:phosphotransferase [Microbacterium sp. WCS2018Hpa-23]